MSQNTKYKPHDSKHTVKIIKYTITNTKQTHKITNITQIQKKQQSSTHSKYNILRMRFTLTETHNVQLPSHIHSTNHEQ